MKLADSTRRDVPTREATIIQYIGHVHGMAKQLRLRVPPCITFDVTVQVVDAVFSSDGMGSALRCDRMAVTR